MYIIGNRTMLYDYQYENDVRIKIWLDELPIQECERTNIVKREYQAGVQDLKDRQIVVELKIPRNISNYGMLGVRYRNTSITVNIQINLSKYDEEIYEESISINPDIVHKGIPEEYVSGIIRSIEQNNGMLLKSGHYEFNVGAHGEVGSSERIFFVLTNIILKLLLEQEISKDVVGQLINAEI